MWIPYIAAAIISEQAYQANERFKLLRLLRERVILLSNDTKLLTIAREFEKAHNLKEGTIEILRKIEKQGNPPKE